MPAGNRSNPLALAVLVCLSERPMHAYEVAATLRRRRKHESVRLNYGSLYAVVATLRKRALIEPSGRTRDRQLPQRTVYTLTDAGRAELVDWLTGLISTPTRDYTSFEAALSFLPTLPPESVAALLHDRAAQLERDIADALAAREFVERQQVPRLFWVEDEYRTVLREAELAYVRRLITDISTGTLGGDDWWVSIHTDDNARAPDDPAS
jgi:DNA-binding PadR family transcriptional regulator